MEALSKENWKQHSLASAGPYQLTAVRSIQFQKEQASQVNLLGSNSNNSICSFVVLVLLAMALFPVGSLSQENPPELTLKDAIDAAIEANIALKSTKEGVEAAMANTRRQKSNMMPSLGLGYQYKRQKSTTLSQFGAETSEDVYTFSSSLTQPVFTGFALLNQYKSAQMGQKISILNETLARQQVIFDTKNAYYSILKAEKLLAIARQTVKQIEAQKEVAQNFYEVGMTPLNDLLQAQVELANAQQRVITAGNNLEIAKSQFNIVLRRPLDTAVNIEDELDYTPLAFSLDYCLQAAQNNRPEIEISQHQIEIARKQTDIAKSGYYPAVNLEWNYAQEGDDWDAKGGFGDFSQSSIWEIKAIASWNVFEFGRTYYDVKEKRHLEAQAELAKTEIEDLISVEVKEAYLNTREAEKNITTVEKAIEQAKENYRINEERYREQVSTATELLIAQTLLTRTMTNYYNALYDFKISKAALLKSMSLDDIQ